MSPVPRSRLISGFLLGSGFLATFLWANEGAAFLALSLLLLLGLREFYSLLDAARIPNFRILGTLAGMGLLIGAWADSRGWNASRGISWQTLALFAGVFSVFLRQFYQGGNARPLETMAGTLMGWLYIAFLLTFFVHVLFAWDGGMSGRWLLLYMVAVVKSTDIGAYFVGSRLGRHKLFPRISPAKSWEGCLGGMAIALMLSVAVRALAGDHLGTVPFRWCDALILPPLLSVAGILGDLMESLLKRSAGVKDSGTLIRGMGGLLDVLDSLLPATPILYYYAIFFMKPHGV
jgi:phosphatidate cytidylyltransferase